MTLERKKVIDLDGVQIELTKLNFGISVRVVEMMRSMFGPIIKAVRAAGKDEEEQVEALGDAVSEAMSNMKDGDLTRFVETILTNGFISINGRKITSFGDLDGI
jgi:hypothetical protein